ncbi:hypothetical protein Hanom_Chr17g01533701 [Helianthus anomalus]
MGFSNLFVLQGTVDTLRSLAEASPRSLSSKGSLTIYKQVNLLVCMLVLTFLALLHIYTNVLNPTPLPHI